MNNLIDKLNQAIDIEYDSKNEELDELQLVPIEERVKKGDTIDNVTAHFIDCVPPELNFKSDLLYFEKVLVKCQSNISKFREGSPVVLTRNGESFKLDVAEDNGEEMILEVGWNNLGIDKRLNNLSGWRIDPAKVDIRSIVKKSTDLLTYDTIKHKRIAGILDGTILPAFSETRKKQAATIIENTGLNEKQQEAFINAYAADTYYLIQGPPGTGKTQVLAHLANAFAKEGKKVLVAASTHTAINNALQKTSILSKRDHIIKVGKKNQREALNNNGSTAKNIADFSRSGYTNSSKGIIVGATCYSPHTKKLEFMEWDVVIIDEAGQLGIPLAVAAMVKAEKYIFIGDHKQLPPIITDKNTDPVFSKSIFEHLFQFSEGTMLNVTYRMNGAINRFPSKYFYGEELLPHSNNAHQLLSLNNSFEKHQEVLDINLPEVLVCHRESSISSRSEHEAALITEYVEQYLSKGVSPAEIAIITPFRAQVRQINKALATLNIDKPILSQIFVDTIERIQGQERDIIIYSLATSNPEEAKQRASFFFNPNRLNVALTRAKKKRIVIANKNLFELKSADAKVNQLIELFKAFYRESYRVEECAKVDYQF